MTGNSNRLSAARRWRSLLRRPTPRTTSETHAWLIDVAVVSGPNKGFVEIAVATQVVRVEHLLLKRQRQSTTGSVITERLQI
jgi:hypothetical protein